MHQRLAQLLDAHPPIDPEEQSVHEVLRPILSRALGRSLGPSSDWVNPTWHVGGGLYLFESDFPDGSYELLRVRADGEIEEVATLSDVDDLRAWAHGLRANPDYAESDTDYEDDDVDVVSNPASVVRTARDERLWSMAKASAARQGRARDWPYVMGIFQHMKHRSGSEPVGNPDDEPWYGSDEARAARLARSAAFQPPELPDYKAISERVERERLEAEEQERQRRKQSEFQLRAEVVQQGLFAPSSYEAKPKKKKPAAPVDTRQVDMFGMPIDDKPRKNPGRPEILRFETRGAANRWMREHGVYGRAHQDARGSWIVIQLDRDKVIALTSPDEGVWLKDW